MFRAFNYGNVLLFIITSKYFTLYIYYFLVLLAGNVTLTLLTWRIGRIPNNASKWQTRFNSEFRGVMVLSTVLLY